MSSTETWYVLENGAVADPAEVMAGEDGVLRHRDGVAVAMRGDVPRSRSIDVKAQREMRPAPGGSGYVTRDTATAEESVPINPAEPDDRELAAARAEYQSVFGRRPYPGWSVVTLREKIAAKAD